MSCLVYFENIVPFQSPLCHFPLKRVYPWNTQWITNADRRQLGAVDYWPGKAWYHVGRAFAGRLPVTSVTKLDCDCVHRKPKLSPGRVLSPCTFICRVIGTTLRRPTSVLSSPSPWYSGWQFAGGQTVTILIASRCQVAVFTDGGRRIALASQSPGLKCTITD